MPVIPEGGDLIDMVARHYEASLDFYGPPSLGARVIRKHLGWYMDDVATPPPDLRREVLSSRDPARVLALLPPQALSEQEAA